MRYNIKRQKAVKSSAKKWERKLWDAYNEQSHTIPDTILRMNSEIGSKWLIYKGYFQSVRHLCKLTALKSWISELTTISKEAGGLEEPTKSGLR